MSEQMNKEYFDVSKKNFAIECYTNQEVRNYLTQLAGWFDLANENRNKSNLELRKQIREVQVEDEFWFDFALTKSSDDDLIWDLLNLKIRIAYEYPTLFNWIDVEGCNVPYEREPFSEDELKQKLPSRTQYEEIYYNCPTL